MPAYCPVLEGCVVNTSLVATTQTASCATSEVATDALVFLPDVPDVASVILAWVMLNLIIFPSMVVEMETGFLSVILRESILEVLSVTEINGAPVKVILVAVMVPLAIKVVPENNAAD